jgi:hypothetical protein
MPRRNWQHFWHSRLGPRKRGSQRRNEIDTIKQHPQRLLGAAAFCARYGVTQRTARRWAMLGRVKSIRIPPVARGKLFFLDPGWIQIDTPTSADPVEWICILRQCDVAKLLGMTARGLRYLESAGKARFRLVGLRKRYSISEVRRLLAARALGHEPRNRQETSAGIVRWARWQLGQK